MFVNRIQNIAKENKKKKTEFDERNAGAWLRILSFTYSWQGTEATANIIINETLAQVFSIEFCKILNSTL